MKILIVFVSIFTIFSCNKIDTPENREARTIILSTQYIGGRDSDEICISDYVEIRQDGSIRGFSYNNDFTHVNYYSLNLSHAILKKIDSLLVDDQVFHLVSHKLEPPYVIYCGPTYKIDIISGSSRKYALFEPVGCNSTQFEITSLFDQIIMEKPKHQIAPFDVKTYFSQSDYELKKYWEELPVH